MSMSEPGWFDAFSHNPVVFVIGGLVGVVSLLVAVGGLALVAKSWKATVVLGALAVLGGTATVGVGVIGWLQARWSTESAVSFPGLSPSEKEKLRAMGEAESAYPLMFNGGLAVLPVAAGLAAVAVGVMKRKKLG